MRLGTIVRDKTVRLGDRYDVGMVLINGERVVLTDGNSYWAVPKEQLIQRSDFDVEWSIRYYRNTLISSARAWKEKNDSGS